MPKEKPIPLTTQEVQDILAGRKTMKRLAIKPQPDHCHRDIAGKENPYNADDWNRLLPQIGEKEIKCPWQVGDILWVRETWKYYEKAVGKGESFRVKQFPAYKADGDNNYIQKSCEWYEGKWKPSIHMPRSAARLFLKVKSIRVERLQDITAEDTQTEGIKLNCKHDDYVCSAHPCDFKTTIACKDYFKNLWNSINSKRGYGWDINPWVWVIEFERVQHG
ncbi:hypothetical protein [Desulfosporosinus nitroreducens]|uniref:hypothetical protein n=1 Tax=Desulfosporosinus nitroreducens TaxID=2018668 RepID=UPI00207C14FA|nr:hypothetical protein [Desulfosporosinus nitroreducens]MCO1599847.1 hypothetical protein [Desulfosporosinus nitroreducens]